MPGDYVFLDCFSAKPDCRTSTELSLDSGEQLTFSASMQGQWHRLFSIAKRSSGWFLIASDGLYRIQEATRIKELCDELLQNNAHDPDQPAVNADTRERFGLVHVIFSQWCRDGKLARERILTQLGWRELSDTESESAWNRVISVLRFRPSINPSGWPSFVEPVPSITWKISRIINSYNCDKELFEATEYSLRMHILDAFRKAAASSSFLALDLNHACYSYEHQKTSIAAIEQWPISISPIGNYHIFVCPDYRCGVLGHPWEESLCAFGVGFVDEIEWNCAAFFDDLLRKKA